MSGSATVQINAPLSHQDPVYEAPQPRKILRWGRRTGKTRLAFTAVVAGHGPEMPARAGGRKFPGLIAGWDSVWLAPDYKQAGVIWNEEIEPRFRGVRGVKVNSSDHTVTLVGAGTLYVATAENLDAIRGKGARIIGVVVDEAAHMDLRRALQSIVLPILLDHAPEGSWLLLSSTTNSGLDGNADQVAPSYFNRLCTQCETGERNPERWYHSYATALDNPLIDEDAFHELVAEYDSTEITLDEEVYARLLAPGAGLAFPEWRRAHHTTLFRPEHDRDVEWRWFAGGDWGYASPGALILLAAGPDRRTIARYCYRFTGQTPYDVGVVFAQKCEQLAARPEWLALDPSAWAVTDGGPSIAEEMQRGIQAVMAARSFPLIAPPKGPGSRVAGKLLVHEALKIKRPKGLPEDAPLPPWAVPRLTIHAEDAAYLVETIPILPRDKKNPEDVDTDADDHAYDGLRYALMARQPAVQRDVDDDWDTHQHPGLVPSGVQDGSVPPMVRRERPSFADRMQETDAMAAPTRRGFRWRSSGGGIALQDDDGGLYE